MHAVFIELMLFSVEKSNSFRRDMALSQRTPPADRGDLEGAGRLAVPLKGGVSGGVPLAFARPLTPLAISPENHIERRRAISPENHINLCSLPRAVDVLRKR